MSRPFADDSELDDMDLWTVDRLLDGSLPESEIPDTYAEIASLVGLVRAGVSPAASGWGSRTVPAMAQIITAPPRRERRRRKVTYARRVSHAAAAVGVFAALGASGAAAATGSLPAPVQSAVHSAADTLGVPIPDPTPVRPSPAVSYTSGGAPAPRTLQGSTSRSMPWVPGRSAPAVVSPDLATPPPRTQAVTTGSTVAADNSNPGTAASVEPPSPQSSTAPVTTVTTPGSDAASQTSSSSGSDAQTPPSTLSPPTSVPPSQGKHSDKHSASASHP